MKYPNKDPSWGYDAYNSIKKLLTKSPDPPSRGLGALGDLGGGGLGLWGLRV